MGRIKVGVIGVGYLGSHHARIYSQLQEVELAGVYDINQEVQKNVNSLSRQAASATSGFSAWYVDTPSGSRAEGMSSGSAESSFRC